MRLTPSIGLRVSLACTALLVVVVPAALDTLSGTPRIFVIPKLTAMHLLTAAGLAGLLWSQRRITFTQRLPGAALWLVGLWVAWLGLTTALAGSPARSWAGSYEWQQGLFTQLGLVAVAALAFENTAAPGGGRTLYGAALLGSLPVCGYGLVQLLGQDPVAWQQWGQAGRVFSAFGNENYFGAYLAMLLPLTLTRACLAHGTPARLAWICLIGLQLLCLLATNSVSAALGAAAACALVVWWRLRFAPGPAWGVLCGGLLLSLIATLAVAIPGDRLGYEVLKVTGREVRPFTWATAYRAALARPLLGWGLSSFDLTHAEAASPGFRERVMPFGRVMDRAHNLWLELAAENGLPGFGLALAGVLSTGYAIMHARKSEGAPEAPAWARGGIAAITAYLIYLLANPSDLGTVAICWWLMGWTLGLAFPDSPPPLTADSESRPADPAPGTGRFILQVLLLVSIFGTVYGVRQWFIVR